MRKLPLFLACTTLLGAPGVYAVGLGELKVRSYLNQPLKAEIAILDVRPDEIGSLQATLASEEAFERAGYSRAAVAGRIRLQVVGGASPKILLSSDRPVRDPALGLVVNLSGPDGSIAREYALLLDPVGYQAPVVTSVAPATPLVERAPDVPVMRGLPDPGSVEIQTRRPAVDTSPMERRINGTYVPVARGETLWSIATRFRAPDVSTWQAMEAIRKANPHAFADPERNETLMSGFSLKIPDVDAMRQVKVAPLAVPAAPKASVVTEEKPSVSTAASAEKPGEARLEIVQPVPVANAPAPVVGEGVAPVPAPDMNVAPASTEDTAQSVALTEQLEASRIEVEQLQQRLNAMQEQREKLEELVKVQELKIQSLEDQLKSVANSASVPSVSAPPQPQPAIAPVPAPAPAEPSLFERLMHPFVLGGVALVLVLGGLLAMRMRRKKAEGSALEEQVEDAFKTHHAADLSHEPAPVTNAEQASWSSIDHAGASATGASGDTEQEALEEADVMRTYGLQDRAIHVLEQAIKSMPDRPALQARRLEMLHDAGMMDEFLEGAQDYRKRFPSSDDAFWPTIAALGLAAFPTHALFKEHDGLDASSDDAQGFARNLDGGHPSVDGPEPVAGAHLDGDPSIPLDDLDFTSQVPADTGLQTAKQQDQGDPLVETPEEPLELPPLELELPSFDQAEPAPVASSPTEPETSVEPAAELKTTRDGAQGEPAALDRLDFSLDIPELEALPASVDASAPTPETDDLLPLDLTADAASLDLDAEQTAQPEADHVEPEVMDSVPERPAIDEPASVGMPAMDARFEPPSSVETARLRDDDLALLGIDPSLLDDAFDADQWFAPMDAPGEGAVPVHNQAATPEDLSAEPFGEPAPSVAAVGGSVLPLADVAPDVQDEGKSVEPLTLDAMDENDTKLSMVQAFIDLGDYDQARAMIEEIMQAGSEAQRVQANAMLSALQG